MNAAIINTERGLRVFQVATANCFTRGSRDTYK